MAQWFTVFLFLFFKSKKQSFFAVYLFAVISDNSTSNLLASLDSFFPLCVFTSLDVSFFSLISLGS